MTEIKTRKSRAIARERALGERHHYTDRTSVRPESNSPVDSRKGGTIRNTNLNLARGGQSCYPRMREGWAGDYPSTRQPDTRSHKHLIKTR